jgi:hypothetical protein
MANTGELSINVVKDEQAKSAERLELKSKWVVQRLQFPLSWVKLPPADTREPNLLMVVVWNTVSPYVSFPRKVYRKGY